MAIVINDLVYEKKNIIYFDNLNLTLSNDKIIGFIGNNRSLLFDLLSGNNFSFSGTIKIDEIAVNKKNKIKIKKKVAYIHQNLDTCFYTLNVYDECFFNLDILGLSTKDNSIDEYLTFLDLEKSILKKSIKELSNLEKIKVILLSKLITKPDIILFDDIVGYLDFHGKRWLANVIKNLKTKYRKKIIFTSNDVDYLYQFVEEVLIIKDGSLIIYDESLKVFTNIKLLNKYNIKVPDLIYFSYLAKIKKSVKINYHKDIRDLIKDVYKHV